MKYFLTCRMPAILFMGCIAAVYFLEIRLLIKWSIRRIHKKPTGRIFTSKSAILLHGLTLLGLLCFLWAFYIEPYRLEINTLTIPTTKLKETSLRIVQISDLHCDKKIRLEPRLVEEINQLHADLLVFTGDALNNQKALPVLQNTLRSMNASLGKYAVRGNVDNRLWKEIDLFTNTGFIELTMDTLVLTKNGESFGLCGIDEALGRNSHQALQHLEAAHFNILLLHTTDLVHYIQPYPLDLYLCGHTHGGQIALPFYGALITQSGSGKKYEAGLYQVGSTRLYVNRGIGMTGGWAPPIRFFARPEITVLDIVPQKSIISEDKTEPTEQNQ